MQPNRGSQLLTETASSKPGDLTRYARETRAVGEGKPCKEKPGKQIAEPRHRIKGIEGEAIENAKLWSGAPTGAGVGRT